MRLAYTALAVVLLAGYVSPAAAQAGGAKRILKQQQKQQKQGKMPALPGPALERFLQMTPEQQQRALEQLPPARRQQLMQRVKQFERLPPDVQDQLRGRYEALLDLPQPRRQAVRQELQRLRRLSPAERKTQIESADEQRNFSSEELDILRGVAAPQ